MKITNCKTNHLNNPLGYSMNTPTFSYIVEESAGHKQTAARILISEKEDMTDPVFDSGYCSDIDFLAYTADFAPAPCTRYFWTVTVQTDADEEETGAVHWFETAKQNEPWTGQWITCDSRESRHPVFSKTFIVKKPVRRARLYIAGLGLYEAGLDGQKIGSEFLTPYCNNYASWIQYQTYELTEIHSGEHTLSVLLGNGWYIGRYGVLDEMNHRKQDETWKLIGELHLLYEDNTTEIIGTDESWQVTRSCITASSIYDGESRDDTLPSATPVSASLLTDEMPPLTPRLSTPVTIHEELPVQQILTTPASETVLDLGQNFSGIFRLRVKEPAGTKIHLQFSELLQDGNFFRGNLRSALAEYNYISNGTEQILEPHFTFYGYRYVKVEGITSLSADDFTGLALYSEIPKTGTLTTGNSAVNQLIQNADWGLKSNFLDIPTDCPQRDERLGWTGDAQAFAPTALYLRDCYAFYRKYLADMSTEQKLNGGAVPNVIPSCGNDGTASVWGDAACIIPWNLYQFCGDASILQERFADMKAWVDYITRTDEGIGKWREVFHWGDWLALDNPSEGDAQVFGGTDAGFIADVYYMNSVQIVSDSAGILGDTAVQKEYQELAGQIRQRILDEFYSPNGRCCISTQTAYLLSLKYHLTTDEKKTAKMLRTLFSQKQDKLQTGFVGTPILCNVLSDYGMTDLAYKLLLNEEYPGWLYAVNLGATTIWERWNSLNPDGSICSSDMSSLNHYTYGSIVEWIWRHAAGITQKEQVPGFCKVVFQPSIHEALRFADGIYHSAAGTWRIRWEIIDNKHLHLKLEVPFGCEAEITLPFASPELYQSVQNPMFDNVTNGICYLKSGSYEITYETTVPLLARLSTSVPISVLKTNTSAAEFLNKNLPGFQMLPDNLGNFELRAFMLQYGQNMGVTEEMLDDLDLKLAAL